MRLRAGIRYSLPADLQIVAAAELSKEVRELLKASLEETVVARPGSRCTAKLIDAATVELLQRFEQPRTVAEAIAPLCEPSPNRETIIESSLRLLERFHQDRFLLADGEPQAIAPILHLGQVYQGWEVAQILRVTSTGDVYRVVRDSGESAAIKLIRPGLNESSSRRALARELVVAKHSNSIGVPKVIEWVGPDDGPEAVVLEWLEGMPVLESMRRQNRVQRMLTARAALAVYVELHKHGFLHGDVHHNNCMHLSNGQVVLIDFGQAQGSCLAVEPARSRAIHPEYIAPEEAALLRENRPLPPSEQNSECYSVGVLVYKCLAGKSPIAFMPDAAHWYQHLCETAPAPLIQFPFLDVVLRKALDKSPQSRFASSVEFLEAFDYAINQENANRTEASSRESMLDSFASPMASVELDSTKTPDVFDGLAGVAFALYRISCLTDDPIMLASADRWATRAIHRAKSRNAELHKPSHSDLLGGFFRGIAGAYAVQALIAYALRDTVTLDISLSAFIDELKAPPETMEVLAGRAGMLLGGMTLIESLPNDRTEALKSSILEYARAFLLELRMMGMPSESLELMSLGFAHGWAGILYTALRVNQIVDDADVDCVLLQIESLASLATTHDGMATIPRLNPSASDDSDTAVSWWCNGSAGYIHLFLEANSLLKHQPYLPLCQGLAKHLVTANDGPSDLCCGVAGRVYALERYARQTGDQDALLDAKRLQSFLVDQSSEFGGSPSLSKGYAGVELLNAEWKYGYCKMPFIESGCSTQRGLV